MNFTDRHYVGVGGATPWDVAMQNLLWWQRKAKVTTLPADCLNRL